MALMKAIPSFKGSLPSQASSVTLNPSVRVKSVIRLAASRRSPPVGIIFGEGQAMSLIESLDGISNQVWPVIIILIGACLVLINEHESGTLLITAPISRAIKSLASSRRWNWRRG
jgi:hypothetical protein